LPIDWAALGQKWRRRWDEAHAFEADPKPGTPKYFLTVAYPYPNSPQHIGHGRTYTLADINARYRRMRGYNVLFPMGFHYTGTPILAMWRRLRDGDEELRDTFAKIYKVPGPAIASFDEAINIARFFHKEIKEGMREMGYSIDWRREFTTIDPLYSRFIEWQFHKLKEKGYVTRGSHPVGWCPKDGNPVGQHDTLGDVEPEIGEFTLLKFSLDGSYVPTATLRAETVLGVTNLWIRPEAEYAVAKVDGEQWIISFECASKLKLQNRRVEVVSRFAGKELLGKEVVNPSTGTSVPILPASFVDPSNATGVVMSVPAHAPYDYQALVDLKRNLTRLAGVDRRIVASIAPISIIEVEGYSDLPARDVVEKMGIRDQSDPRLEDATKEVYSHEFHRGRMKSNTGPYADCSVAEAREAVRRDLREKGLADAMYEILNRPVTCRCGTECVVKIFEDQWFINYGDSGWKELAHDCLRSMSILPEEVRPEFEYTVDWLREKACARKSGLGTRLPWDPDWIIESLSDSVIYMSYYILAKYVNDGSLRPEAVGGDFFDYALLGSPRRGSAVGLDQALLESVRNEFTYFYPLDSRHSGRDLVPNHLTFFIFNHVAIFPRELWPRQIVVNGSVLMEGKKMSKSFGNIVPLREAIAAYGADPLRVSILSTAELMQDADFSTSLARSTKEKLERIYDLAMEILKLGEGGARGLPERWLLSRLQRRIEAATNAMETFRVREAVNQVVYGIDLDVQWYRRRSSFGGGPSGGVLRKLLDARVRMLAPFAPHLAEELWEEMGGEGLVALAPWPEPDPRLIDPRAEESEELIRRTMRDTADILNVTAISPKRIFYYTAADWKWKVYSRTLRSTGIPEARALIEELSADPELREWGKEIPKFVLRLVEEVSKMPYENRLRGAGFGPEDELQALSDAMKLLENEFRAKIEVFREADPSKYDPKDKARSSVPLRPAIYVE